VTLLRKARLSRRLDVLTRTARLTASYREELRVTVTFCTGLREALADSGIDPARVSCLFMCNDAAAELASLGDTPALRRADAAFSAAFGEPSGDEDFAARLARLLPRFADGAPPQPGASLMDWLAWALARRQPGRPPPPDRR
jgi:hypothetical protein